MHACMHACMHAYIHSTIMIDYVELHNKRYIIKNSKHKWPWITNAVPRQIVSRQTVQTIPHCLKVLDTPRNCFKLPEVIRLRTSWGSIGDKEKKETKRGQHKGRSKPTQSEALRIAFMVLQWKVMESYGKLKCQFQALSLWIATPRSASMDVTFEIP